jgi:hypothetical protein
MCQYLHTRQCPWDSMLTAAEAYNDHVDLLRWLVDYGCPWDAQVSYHMAASLGSVEVLNYLQQQGLLTSTLVIGDLLMRATSVVAFADTVNNYWLNSLYTVVLLLPSAPMTQCCCHRYC